MKVLRTRAQGVDVAGGYGHGEPVRISEVGAASRGTVRLHVDEPRRGAVLGHPQRRARLLAEHLIPFTPEDGGAYSLPS